MNTNTSETGPKGRLMRVFTCVRILAVQVWVQDAPAIAQMDVGQQKQADNGAWQDSGATLTLVSVSGHTLELQALAGWDAPSPSLGAMMIATGQTTSWAEGDTAAQKEPLIQIQPQSLSIREGTNVTFTVVAAGAEPLSYQWQFNGKTLLGQTAAILTLTLAKPFHSGEYRVLVSNAFGTTVSAGANLTVYANRPWIVTVSKSTPDSAAELWLTTKPSQTTIVEVSEDLVRWTLLKTQDADAKGRLSVIDSEARFHQQRFYRAAVPQSEFLSEMPERIVLISQGWGELGFDTAAHQPGQIGSPLQIAQQYYVKGLGHHANGTILVSLDGEFASFAAEIGLQPTGSTNGSVVFRVLVDGQLSFDSGIMRPEDAAKSVQVSVAGAQELRLEVSDADDGIGWDMANWANARLTRSTNANPSVVSEPVNIARFARVATWDPDRLDGCRAGRSEEFLADDVFLESELSPNADGFYVVPAATKGCSCIGLQWLNKRELRQLSVQFAEATPGLEPGAVQVQGWYGVSAWLPAIGSRGMSAWQGNWQPLPGTNSLEGDRLVFRMASPPDNTGPPRVQKVRWIFPPSSGPLVVRNLSAFTYTSWDRVKLLAEVENFSNNAQGVVRVYNGEHTDPANAVWDLSRPLPLTVRYGHFSWGNSDATVLQFRLPTGTVGVAVDDVLSNECVYVPDHRLFVTRDPPPISLAAYKAKIAGLKTILQEVRDLPDQTLSQAMAITHQAAQQEGPVLLSLACDNTKFMVERDGIVRFQTSPRTEADWLVSAGEMRPQFGGGHNETLKRKLDGDWLPIPILTVEEEGVVYSQRVFVAPVDEDALQPAQLNRRSVCVVELSVTNPQASPVNASLACSLLVNSRQHKPAQLLRCDAGYQVVNETEILGLIAVSESEDLNVLVTNETLRLSGTLAPHTTKRCVVYLPGPQVDLLNLPPPERLRRDCEVYWQTVLAPAMQVVTPEPLLNHLLRSSQVRCLIAARNEAEGARILPCIAALNYGPVDSESHSILRGMSFLGHEDFARRGLDFFINRYNTNGFLTTGYTLYGTAWHLWTLGEHFQLHREDAWLNWVAPEIVRVGQWIMRQTEKTKRLGPEGNPVPEYGLLPPGVLADWDTFAYHFCLNAYYYAALREAGSALVVIGDGHGPEFLEKAAELQDNIVRAYRWTQAQAPALPLRDGRWIPAYPAQVHCPGKVVDFFPDQDSVRHGAYDVELGAHHLASAGVLEANSPEVAQMMDHMEDVLFLSEGWFDYPAEMNKKDWFNLGGFSKAQPYYTRNAEIYARRDDVKPFLRSYFNTLAAMVNPEVLTFWEHFNHTGAWDKTHETGYFLQQTRFMLIMERGDDLWLAPLITRNWLRDGLSLAVNNAPTRFGKVSYRITSHEKAGYLEAIIEPPNRKSPNTIVLRLRHPEGKRLGSVLVNDSPLTDFDPVNETISLKPTPKTLTVRAWYP